MDTQKFYAYVLQSIEYKKFYTGHTQDLEKRLTEHNSGKTPSNKKYAPWKLIYYEEFETRVEAVIRERYFKSGIGREFLKSIKIK